MNFAPIPRCIKTYDTSILSDASTSSKRVGVYEIGKPVSSSSSEEVRFESIKKREESLDSSEKQKTFLKSNSESSEHGYNKSDYEVDVRSTPTLKMRHTMPLAGNVLIERESSFSSSAGEAGLPRSEDFV